MGFSTNDVEKNEVFTYKRVKLYPYLTWYTKILVRMLRNCAGRILK